MIYDFQHDIKISIYNEKKRQLCTDPQKSDLKI